MIRSRPRDAAVYSPASHRHGGKRAAGAACRTTRSSSRLSAWTAFLGFHHHRIHGQRSKPCRENIFPSQADRVCAVFGDYLRAADRHVRRHAHFRLCGRSAARTCHGSRAARRPGGGGCCRLTVGICYDLSFTGVDGLYPCFSCCSAMPPESSARDCSPAITFPCSSLRRLSVCCSRSAAVSLLADACRRVLPDRPAAACRRYGADLPVLLYRLPALRRLSGKSRKRSR